MLVVKSLAMGYKFESQRRINTLHFFILPCISLLFLYLIFFLFVLCDLEKKTHDRISFTINFGKLVSQSI